MEITFLKAMLTHLRLENESLSDFRQQMSKLTEPDKDQLKVQFEKEFDYKIVAPKAA